jgi:hypothetical protein
VGLAFILAFVKIEGFPIPTVGKNLVNYSFNSKMFIWKRKQSPVFLSSTKRQETNKNNKKPNPSPLKIKQAGKMEDLIRKIDFEK